MQLPETIHSLQTRRFLLLLCVSVLSFMINLDANIVAVSPSAIAHADFAAVEWVVSAYTLTFACRVLPPALAGRYGRRRIMMLGLGVFTAASLFCGAAPSMAMLNSARALQGVGTALQPSASLAILSHDFRGVERARAFAFWGSVVGIAITLGPASACGRLGTINLRQNGALCGLQTARRKRPVIKLGDAACRLTQSRATATAFVGPVRRSPRFCHPSLLFP
jgi:MFS family permease